MKNRQLEHSEINNSEKSFDLIAICENIESPENIGMIFRICEAMGVKKIIFSGSTITLPNKRISKISRSTNKIIPFAYYSNTIQAIKELEKEDYKIIALEITETSKELSQTVFQINTKYALIIGSEKHGITAETLNHVNDCIEIKLFGKNTSINVVSALSIALYEVTKQIK